MSSDLMEPVMKQFRQFLGGLTNANAPGFEDSAAQAEARVLYNGWIKQVDQVSTARSAAQDRQFRSEVENQGC